MPTYLHSLDPDGVMFYNRVVSVIKAGKKPVVKLSLVSGESLVLTSTHPVGIPGGRYVPVGELNPGDHVLLRGSMKPQATGGKKLDARPPRRIENVKYHPYGSYHEDGEYYAYKRIAYARLVVEAHMNEMEVEEYLHALKHNERMAASFEFLPPEMEVHHVDEDTMNDELSNLMVLEKAEHAREHSKLENFTVEYVRIGEVASVEDAGSVMTYDVQMDMPANNFVANGILVHNTGKSLVAKAVASELGVPLVRLDFGRVFNSLVGASEQRMRTALKMVESMSPCVLFCVDGKTNVTLSDGTTERIEDMYSNTQKGATYTLQGVCPETGALITLPMSSIIRTQGKPMVKITSATGKTIEVTTDHRLLVNREGERVWVPASELSVGDDLVEV